MPKKTALAGASQVPMPELDSSIAGMDQEYELVDIDAICPHPDNPNHGDVDAIEESIDANGWYGVCTVQRSTGYIIAGSHRYKAAQRAGATRVPVVWKDVDDVVAIRILLADNETARRATVDRYQVSQLLEQLGEVRGTGFRALQELEAEEAEREAEEAEQEAAKQAELYEPGDDVYANQYGVIVVCDDEADQRAKYEELKAMGWKIRVVAV